MRDSRFFRQEGSLSEKKGRTIIIEENYINHGSGQVRSLTVLGAGRLKSTRRERLSEMKADERLTKVPRGEEYEVGT